MTTKLQAAQQYIDRGWPVFVLGADKTPTKNCAACQPDVAGSNHDRENCSCLMCHGFYAATLDIARVEAMIAARPDGMLALRTGGKGRLVVVDAEASPSPIASHNGITGLDVLDSWETWIGDDWSLPKTLRQRSGKGGLHFVYEIPVGVRVSSHNRVLPQIDIKAEFGYIAAWSGDDGGDGRKWIDPFDAIVEASPQLLSWLVEIKGKSVGGGAGWGTVLSGEPYKEALKNGPGPGEREGFFARLSFDCFAAGMEKHAVEALMYEHWLRCAQPLGDEFPWHWVEYKIHRDSVNVKPDEKQEIPAWRPSTAGLGHTAVIPTDSEVAIPTSVIADGPGRPDLLFHFSDTGRGERYAQRMRDVARYDPINNTWFVWNGAHWIQDTYGRALLWTKEIIKDIYVEAAAYTGDDETLTDRLIDFARGSESMAARQAMLRAASLEEGMVVQPDHFDANPWVLVVRNGTIELKTGELRESRPEDLNTKCADVFYDADAKAPKWIAHVNFLANGDKHLAAYLQRVAGYILTGLIIEQKFFFFEGKGANGKNVFIEPLLMMMGTYGLVGQSALLTGGDEQHPTILAQLLGKRMVFIDEAKQGKALNVERIKQLTGSAKISGRKMKEDFFDFDARLKLLIAGNNHPKISDTTDGTWRRMQRIMCKNKVADKDIVKDYAKILFDDEASGILNWCLEGLKAWQELGGLATPQSVMDSVAEYRNEEDLIGVFLEECCVVTHGPDDWASVDEMFSAYQLWAGLAGLKGADLYNKITFGKHMATKDLEAKQKKIGGENRRRYQGVRMLTVPTSWPNGKLG